MNWNMTSSLQCGKPCIFWGLVKTWSSSESPLWGVCIKVQLTINLKDTSLAKCNG